MAKKWVMILGVVFVLIGLLGFFNNPILGLFAVDNTHNIVHLASGILAIIAANSGESASKMFAKIFGIVYALVTILGFMGDGSVLGIITVNGADNVLHLVLAAVLLWIGFSKSNEMMVNA